MLDFFDWIFGVYEKDHSPENLDDRVYQKKGGQLYIKSNEFAQSEEGRKLLKRFTENIEEGDTIQD